MLFCNGRARAVGGWVNAQRALNLLDLWGFSENEPGAFAVVNGHCVATMSTDWCVQMVETKGVRALREACVRAILDFYPLDRSR